MKELIKKPVYLLKKFIQKIMWRIKYRYKIMLILGTFTLIPVIVFGITYISMFWNAEIKKNLEVVNGELNMKIERIAGIYATKVQKLSFMCNFLPNFGVLTKNYYNDFPSMNEDYMSIAQNFNAIDYDGYDNSGRSMAVYALNQTLYSGEYIKKMSDLYSIYINGIDIEEKIRGNELNQVLLEHTIMTEVKPQNEYISFFKKIRDISGSMIAISEVRVPLWRVKDEIMDIPKDSFAVYAAQREEGYDTVFIQDNGVDQETISEVTGVALKDDISKYLALDSKNFSNGYYKLCNQVGQYKGQYIILFVKKNYFDQKMEIILIFLFSIMFLLIIIIALVIKAVSLLMTKRLSYLMKTIELEGNEVSLVYKEDEFTILNKRFIEMVEKIKLYYQQNLDMAVEKKIMEMELLQMGINPHFLYNTLSTVKLAYNDEKLTQLIDSMVKYFRMALIKGKKTILISQEEGLIKEYIEIMRFAHNNKFTYNIDFDADIHNYLILRNLLQPIIENAIIHGAMCIGSGGAVSVKGKMEDGRIVFEVSDNGVGMKQERIDKMLMENDSNLDMGYGFSNVLKRIKLFYGTNYGVTIDSQLGKGTIVRVELPCLNNEM